MLEAVRIDMDTYPRREHFDYFRKMAYPYVGLTAEVDITDFLDAVHRRETPFFLNFLYQAATAAISVPELRRRIDGEGIVEYSSCPTSHTLALTDGTYCYCLLEYELTVDEFIPYALERQRLALEAPSLDEGEDTLPLMFITSVPWLSYTGLVQPTPSPADSNPRISWGGYREVNGRTLMPVSVLVNHALADGLHISRFYAALNENLARFAAE